MSAEQIAAFKQLFPEGNSREIQPLNGRTVLTDVAPQVV
jgi:carbonic anhydrase